MSFQQLIAFQRKARFQRRIQVALVNLLAGLLALPVQAQDVDTSLPSTPAHFQEGGLSRIKGYESQAVKTALDQTVLGQVLPFALQGSV